jgi:hypothetical protein
MYSVLNLKSHSINNLYLYHYSSGYYSHDDLNSFRLLRREKRLSISPIWQRLILSQARFFPLPSRVLVLIRLLAFVRR